MAAIQETDTSNHQPVAKVDPMLVDLIPNYVANRKRDFQKMREGLKKGNTDVLHWVLHDMMGHSQSYGFQGLYDLVMKAREHYDSPEAFAIIVNEMELYMSEVHIMIDESQA
jgi:hypothetical protein